MPLVTFPKAAYPCPSALFSPPKSKPGKSVRVMKNSELAVPGASLASDKVPATCVRPVFSVVSWGMKGSSGLF